MIKLLFIIFFFIVRPVNAELSDDFTVEQMQKDAAYALAVFEESLSFRTRQEFVRVPWNKRLKLRPSLRDQYTRWYRLHTERDKWEHAVELKKVLLSLHQKSDQSNLELQGEANRISREVIQVLYKYRKEWGMLNSALMHNIFVNLNMKEQGFCWHWVEKFLGTLRPLEFQHFDLHWGVAYEGKWRENNALVISRRSADFEAGLAIDAWRSSGRPFWRLVKKDRFPWVKRDESTITLGEFDSATATAAP